MTTLDNIHLEKIDCPANYPIKGDEQEKEIKKLNDIIIALKIKMELIYNNWNYDNVRFQELKEKCKITYSC